MQLFYKFSLSKYLYEKKQTKEGNVLFHNALNTFYLQLYGVVQNKWPKGKRKIVESWNFVYALLLVVLIIY